MLCSISTAKSGSTWLDRLRSNKGFPTGDNLNNDVSNSNTDSDDKPIATAETTEIEISSEKDKDKDKEWFGIMTNVLCELFNMGDSQESARISGRKSLRKQTNPKFCVISSSTTTTTPGVNNVINVLLDEEKKQKSFDCVRNDENVLAVTDTTKSTEENNDVEEKELFGYSRSEVTVIDTSFSVWKFDKLVFRRKNVWKVRDKKAKSRTLGRKKRKGTTFDDADAIAIANANANANPIPNPNPNPNPNPTTVVSYKKPKVLSSSDTHCAVASTHVSQNPQDNKEGEVCKETLDDLSQVPDKRSPRKSRKGDSSVILIKGIPTSKNSGARLPKGGFKDSQRQHKA